MSMIISKTIHMAKKLIKEKPAAQRQEMVIGTLALLQYFMIVAVR